MYYFIDRLTNRRIQLIKNRLTLFKLTAALNWSNRTMQ